MALALLFALFAEVRGEAQDDASRPLKEAQALGRYFSKPIDLWKAGLPLIRGVRVAETPASLPERVALRENVWAQPIRTPDGNWTIYVPPKQILDFLESPTEDSARAYLAWKAQQSEKLKKAMLLLAKVKDAAASASTSASAAPSSPEAPGGKAAGKSAPPDFPFRITYFKKPSCPHCVSQDAVLSDWLTRRDAGKLEVLLPGERAELWKSYQVRGTPTLVLEAGSPGRSTVLVGLQQAAALEEALAGLALPSLDPTPEPRKEPPR